MAVEIKVDQDDLAGFSGHAQERLKNAAEQYVAELIREANRLEAGRNSGNSPPEITEYMVNDAVTLQRHHGFSSAKPIAWTSKILRVASAVLSLGIGIMYNGERLQDPLYLVAFVIVIALAILTMTISVFKE